MKQKTLLGWILGSDKMSYTAEYETNQTFSTYFTDLNGNKILKEIKINQVDQSGSPNINVSYQYNSNNNTVIITAKSKSSSWTLSDDGDTYTKMFYENVSYTTWVDDINGLNKQVKINVDFFANKIVYETGTYGYTEAVYKSSRVTAT